MNESIMDEKWYLMTPEFIVLLAAVIISLLDLFLPKKVNRLVLGWLSVLAVLAGGIVLLLFSGVDSASILYGTFQLDAFAKAFKLILMIGVLLILLMSMHKGEENGSENVRGEYFYLLLTALLGAMMLSSSGDLITLFVGLELLAVSSYILAGIKKDDIRSNEAALKYVVNGGISTAITLFGMSYLYGVTGTTNLAKMGEALSGVYDSGLQLLLGISFLLILVGLAFKTATVPFHMWVADVYEGAPAAVTAFLSAVSKTAGFILLLRLLAGIFAAAPSKGLTSVSMLTDMRMYIAALAAAAMIIGTLGALRQRNIKRMLAYSSIVHGGYLLGAVASLSIFMMDTIWFYLLTYTLMTIGTFVIIQWVIMQTKSNDISGFAGLYQRSPWTAGTLGILLLSLAGIPGTAGFIAKLKIIMSLLVQDNSLWWLAIIMIVATVVSYVYYFGIFIQVFFRKEEQILKDRLSFGGKLALCIAVAATVLFGILPNIPLDYFQHYFGS
ncbi:NADH-quinone oxidoreductase subunit NuoN [Falsibacillus pallidus]|uniref:NADH-quinone oxidoreductase subunit N n=1 Tax=Falsibacillus pallidus TaxID=493781 RepID=A0A370GCR2_9BACI|nr:NADH-quinone oxidoreductase subunit NuoN [Falsibacillus pallidus]RDI41605.1 NADH dehydrogenase subunit N [Falsibacillus pallidus]